MEEQSEAFTLVPNLPVPLQLKFTNDEYMAAPAIHYGTLTGTSLMTLFSYYLSRKANRNFREPVLMNQLIFNFQLFEFIRKPILPVCILHYAVGFIFGT